MKTWLVGIAAVSLLLSPPSALARGAGSTRPGGGGSGGGHAPTHVGGSSGGSHPSSGGAPTRVSGHATYGYGYGSGNGGYGGYYPYYPYYGYGWGWYGAWGYPWYSAGLWWPPYYGSYAMQPETLALGGSRSSAPAAVETDVRPGKATLRIDGEEIGRAKDFNGTWDRLTIPSGTHVLEFSAEGYTTLRTTIHLQPGRLYRIEHDLQKGVGVDDRTEPPSAAGAGETNPSEETDAHPQEASAGGSLERGFLKIAADPPDAAVYLDGEFLASARELSALHGAIPVAMGEHRVEVIHPRFESRSLRVEVSGAEPVHVDLRIGEERAEPRTN